ncbi:serine/threonine-protein kinase [Yinghuangia seranimata]|uniref:serine/threonine-protein kinase n=1 Tax=Yinghuangia seranimata TaxID=408067 RepID=UPI00248ABD7A|nr:serine/threonine-protein kinase [Yinghuangia seranimata]MDI2126349.1 serine/threonine-protein kinase [Yinghuangia seranimata]
MTAPGRIIADRYELSVAVGRGGMGQVWKAYDRTLQRRVAVKLLRSDLVGGGSDRATLERRFLRECRVTAGIDHPGLVTVYDAGMDDGDLYLVMQLLDGMDLGDLIAEQDQVPWEWVVAVAAQICSVLAAIHAAPVVHRDLKPRNVMVRRDGTVKVLDLGVAAVLDPDSTKLTNTGSLPGSPAYMAPEQALTGLAEPRSDLYALGCLMYEMLAGRAPFTAPTVLAVLQRHLTDRPDPVGTHRPDVPAGLDRLVSDLLEKQPEDRPATAQEVYRRLVPLLPAAVRDADAALAPATAMDPTRPLRHPAAPQPSPVVVADVSVSGDLGAVPQPSHVVPPTASSGVPPQAFAPPVSAVPPVPSVPPGVPRQAAAPAPVPAFGGEPVTDITATDWSAVPSAAPDPGPGGLDVADALDAAARLLGESQLAQAVDVLGAALPAAVARHGEHDPVVLELRQALADTLLADRQYRRALPELEYLAVAFAARLGPLDAEAMEYRRQVASCLEELGDTHRALHEYRALYEAFRTVPNGDRHFGFEVRERIGLLLAAVGDAYQAESVLGPLLAEEQRTLGAHHPQVVALGQQLARIQGMRTAWRP